MRVQTVYSFLLVDMHVHFSVLTPMSEMVVVLLCRTLSELLLSGDVTFLCHGDSMHPCSMGASANL